MAGRTDAESLGRDRPRSSVELLGIAPVVRRRYLDTRL